MKPILKFNLEEISKIYFASDFHLNHKQEFIWKSRGFSSIEDHREFIINNLLDNLTENDYLFYLGDMLLTTSKEQLLDVWKRLEHLNIYYIFGNHENPLYEMRDNPLNPFYMLGQKTTIQVGRKLINLNHFPELIWWDQQHYSWMLCGHSHGDCDLTNLKNSKNYILDCGYEVAMQVTNNQRCFVSYSEIKEIFGKRELDIPDRHQDLIVSKKFS